MRYTIAAASLALAAGLGACGGGESEGGRENPATLTTSEDMEATAPGYDAVRDTDGAAGAAGASPGVQADDTTIRTEDAAPTGQSGDHGAQSQTQGSIHPEPNAAGEVPSVNTTRPD